MERRFGRNVPKPGKSEQRLSTGSARPRSNGHARTVRLTIPAKAEYITLVRLALSGLSQLRPLSDETLGDLKLAVTEACSNSVRHAYRDGRAGAVEIIYELHPDRLVVEVCDEGEGFANSERMPATDRTLIEGGLGIAIIRELADELELGPGAGGKGSRLRFVKFIQE
jgi:serine/threonine-protein kinase RsbW